MFLIGLADEINTKRCEKIHGQNAIIRYSALATNFQENRIAFVLMHSLIFTLKLPKHIGRLSEKKETTSTND